MQPTLAGPSASVTLLPLEISGKFAQCLHLLNWGFEMKARLSTGSRQASSATSFCITNKKTGAKRHFQRRKKTVPEFTFNYETPKGRLCDTLVVSDDIALNVLAEALNDPGGYTVSLDFSKLSVVDSK